MTEPIVFFSRCKPKMSDAVDLALKYRILFIGYPLRRADALYDPRNLGSCIVSPDANELEWEAARRRSDKNNNYMMNRNFAKTVKCGSVALVPRPDRGLVYVGIVKGKFEFVDCPEWYEEYLTLRAAQGLSQDVNGEWHAGDICQIWRVECFHALAYPKVPAWIRASLFGRSTYGRVKDLPEGQSAHSVLTGLVSGINNETKVASGTREDVACRLSNYLTPSIFEHLMVSLLQLEQRDYRGMHVGGTGDGGADGLCYSAEDRLLAVLQCKFRFYGNLNAEIERCKTKSQSVELYFATFHHVRKIVPMPGVQILTQHNIVDLVIKHRRALPVAVTLGIDG
jgi:hypothetical protein